MVDVWKGDEKTIGSRKKDLQIKLLSSSCRAVIVEGDTEISHWVKEISCWFYDDHAPIVLGQSEWHNRRLLVADTRIPSCLFICKQLRNCEFEVLDIVNQISLKSWLLSPRIFDEIGHSADLPNGIYVLSGDKDLGEGWNELLWDKENDRYLLGVRRSSGWGSNYYQVHEWLELKLNL